MPLPYLPGGVASLPAQRFVLFADTANIVHRINEATLQKNGVNFTSRWRTPTLNQLAEGREFTLRALELMYAALTTTSVRVLVSNNGGETFSAAQVVALPQTLGRVARVWVTFDGVAEATGFDLQAQFEMDQNALHVLYGYKPHLADRGELIV